MGVFISEDGHFQGWLAAVLCCCAAVNNDEDPVELEKDKERELTEESRQRSWYGQPIPLTVLPTESVHTAHHPYEYSGSSDMEYVSSSLSSITKGPLPRATSLRMSKRSSDFSSNEQKQHGTRITTQHLNERPVIGLPSTTRRLELSADQRQCLVPLRLGPVVLRDMPTTIGESSTMQRISEEALDERNDSSRDSLSDASVCGLASTEHHGSNDDLPQQLLQASQQLQSVSSDHQYGASIIEREHRLSARLASYTRSFSTPYHHRSYTNSISFITTSLSIEQPEVRRTYSFDQTPRSTATQAASHAHRKKVLPAQASGWISETSETSCSSPGHAYTEESDGFQETEEPQSYSEMSIRSSLSETSSPSLTATSSPTKGHSRSPTGESQRVPTLSAPHYSVYRPNSDEKYMIYEEDWPQQGESQFGIAI